MQPMIRHMLLCDVVRKRKDSSLKFDLLGQFNTVRPTGDFPLRLSFSVFVTMTGGRGSGQCGIRIIEADTDELIHEGNEHSIRFDPDPTRIHAATIRVGSCTIHQPGLYHVEFMYNGAELAQEPLVVKESL
jgi:Family of unknown function (DUF6941)